MDKANENDSSSASTIGRTVPLDVLDSPKNHAPMMGRTKTARWRTGVLILVHVLMIAHLVQWLIAGSTISPIEPSESMETIEVGVVNAGAIMLLLALVGTALFGRFFCGWLCHMVALQDLCAYIMTSIGIRPKPFRSRLLVFVPLILGFYMFLWPTSKKLILVPVLRALEIDWPAWIKPVHPIQRWENGLVVDDFWATFPDWYIVVPFLLICGFATVYFLGAKGLCTYACPYGGFFAPLERLAPVRIRVNDDCHQCGYCTSVCTSNVRVHEQVRDFGMVIDNGCMKTLDCVSACPNDALSLGIGRPSLGASARSPETAKAAKRKRNRRYDMSWGEEIFAAFVFLWLFVATRGMLDQVPMLLAGGLAACGTMMTMTTLWMVTRPNARLYGLHLKDKGKIRFAGIVVGLLMVAFFVGSVWAGHARLARWRADVLYAGSKTPTGYLFRTEHTPSAGQLAEAESAVRWYKRADSFENDGFGWELNAEHRLRMSYFLLMLDRDRESADILLTVINEGNPTDNLVFQAEQLMLRAGSSQEEAQAMMDDALAKHPRLHRVRGKVAMQVARVKGLAFAESYWTQEDAPSDEPGYLLEQMRYYGIAGNLDKMMAQYESTVDAAREGQNASGWLIDIAVLVGRFRYLDQMHELLDEAVDLPGISPSSLLSAAELFVAVEDRQRAEELVERALLKRTGGEPMIRARAAGVIMTAQTAERAQAMLVQAAEESEDPFETIGIARGMLRGGMSINSMELVQAGLAQAQRVVDEHPELVILRHDFASFLQGAGEGERGAEEMSKAAELEAGSAIFATRASEMWARAGDDEKSAHWREEAERRGAAAQP